MHGLLRLLVTEPDGRRDLEVDECIDVAALVRHLGADTMTWLVAVNGQAASQTTRLKAGDRVDIYPSLEGG